MVLFLALAGHPICTDGQCSISDPGWTVINGTSCAPVFRGNGLMGSFQRRAFALCSRAFRLNIIQAATANAIAEFPKQTVEHIARHGEFFSALRGPPLGV